MPTLTSLTVLLEGDASGLVEATKRGANAIKGFGAEAGRLAAIGTAAGVAGLAAAAGTITAIGNAARKSVNAHTQNAAALGISVKNAQLLGQVSQQSGVKIKDLADGVKKVGGIVAFKGLALGLKGILDATDRAEAGTKIFGKTYKKIAPVFADGNTSLEDADKIINGLGLGLGESAANAELLTTKMDSLGQLARSLRDKVFSEFSPAMGEFASQMFQVATAFIEANGGGEKLATTISTNLIDGIKGTVEWFRQMKESISGILTVAQFLIDSIQAVNTVTGGLAAAAGAVARGEFSGAQSILSSLGSDALGKFDNDDKSAELVDETKRQTSVLERMANRSLVNFQGP